jgi:alkylated DNA repair dioxygenase AlkB
MKDIVVNNILGITMYQSNFIDQEISQKLFEYLYNELPWIHDEARIYGKTIITKRKIVWYADKSYNYDYSWKSRIALSWNMKILEIRNLLEKETGYRFNSCLLNLYHTGEEGMAWHSDDQNDLEPDSPVAIISFWAERYFKLRLTKEKTYQHKIILEQWSLLMMLGETQKHWQHEIPKMARIKTPRISLTWRIMHKSKL